MTYLNPQPSTVADNIQMTYDGFGRRSSIIEKHGSTVLASKTLVWCGAQLCEERDTIGSTPTTKWFYKRGELITVAGTSNKYFYSFDHLGSVRAMFDSNKNILANYDYDPWGRQTKLSGVMDADFGYTGFYQEKAAGLDLTWFRAYDPDKGRWLSRDPLGKFADINLYNYSLNNPIDFVDRFGLWSFGSEWGGGGYAGMASGIGGMGTAGAGFFFGPGFMFNGTGDFATAGGFAGMPTGANGFGIGGGAGVGVGGWISNACNEPQLNGPFNTTQVWFPFVTFTWQEGIDANGNKFWF